MSSTTVEQRAPNREPTPQPPSRPNSLKRKEPEDNEPDTGRSSPAAAPKDQGEYEKGRVICEVCSSGVSFRDEDTGAFTLKHWDAHRVNCAAPAPSPSIIYTPESTAQALANPPAKRRRAKRTEEERIDYLRADPYVAQFEPYRVLCASCDKWIRLRPNSTYCSIPWDAHRKSCLSKKISSKNVYALEERDSMFAKDPDVRKFDAERVLCNTCDKWLSLNPDDHMQAVQTWLQHRSSCQKGPSRLLTSSSISSREQHVPTPSTSSSHHRHPHSYSSSSKPTSPNLRTPISTPTHPRTQSTCHSESPPSYHEPGYHPTNLAPAHESRRRNAEQRAATLRADKLIGEVEPNRVFCSLCEKWVQLRQDSSFCAYPWLQHRGKCLARHQRRVQKTADIAEMKARRLVVNGDDEVASDSDVSEEPESEEGVDLDAEHDRMRRNEGRTLHRPNPRAPHAHSPVAQYLPLRNGRGEPALPYGPSHSSRGGRFWRAEDDVDMDGEADAEGSLDGEGSNSSHRPPVRAPIRRVWPVGLADLDSPSGRKSFVFASVDYLFATTYESSDDMTISALLTYLNAAMPPDKHEDFDTSEVVKAAVALQEKGHIAFEGDMLRLVN